MKKILIIIILILNTLVSVGAKTRFEILNEIRVKENLLNRQVKFMYALMKFNYSLNNYDVNSPHKAKATSLMNAFEAKLKSNYEDIRSLKKQLKKR